MIQSTIAIRHFPDTYMRSLRKVLAIAIIGIVALLLTALWILESARLQSVCDSQIHGVYMALLRFEECYGALPAMVTENPEIVPALSWRAVVLAFVEGMDNEGFRYREPWGSAHNVQAIRKMAAAREAKSAGPWICPNEKNDPTGETNYFLVPIEEVFAFSSEVDFGFQSALAVNDDLALVECSGTNISWDDPVDIRLAMAGSMSESDLRRSLPLRSNDCDGPQIIRMSTGKRIRVRNRNERIRVLRSDGPQFTDKQIHKVDALGRKEGN